MLPFYARHFRVVEVDSTYYHMPSERNFALWVERTPKHFVFDVKAYRRLTQHDRGEEPTADDFDRFASALRPVDEAGKLGCVLFQFPPWFKHAPENFDYIRECRDQMPDYQLAIEFRHGSWVSRANVDETLHFLREEGLAYVCVDEPQFRGSTVPPLAEATADLSVVRFHGRNYKNWFKRDNTVEDRFCYLYTPDELAEWVPKIESLAQQAQQVHVLMNNCSSDYSVRNARDVEALLAERDARTRAAG
ncbi:MAG: DUF72 domain-containing protein [Chloroflexi bacterium]|nr:DUF72 domain-containing protein [Chloroflexota bacterium]